MGHLEETNLPGIGTRLEFISDEGRRLGVVRHRGGRREVFVCQPGDPDTSQVAVNLTEDDAHLFVEALDVNPTRENLGTGTYEVEGLVFEWLEVPAASPAAGRSIGDLRIRTRTGASVVAVIRDSGSVPAPEPGFVIAVGDLLVVAGTPEGVERARRLLAT